MFPFSPDEEHPITASADTLMRQASMTAETYFHKAVQAIDEEFGEGYAKQNPQLIGSMVQAAAADLAGSIQAQQIRAGLDHIASALEPLIYLSDIGKGTKQLELLDDVARSLGSVADSVEYVSNSLDALTAGQTAHA